MTLASPLELGAAFHAVYNGNERVSNNVQAEHLVIREIERVRERGEGGDDYYTLIVIRQEHLFFYNISAAFFSLF